MERIAGIILAAGESARMGQDKALLPWGTTTFLGHLLDSLRKTRVGLIRVVLGANAPAVRGKIEFGIAEMVVNPHWAQGQLSSLIRGLDSLPAGMVEGAVVCLVDHPCISSRLIDSLLEGFNQSGKLIILPTYQGRRGHPVLFSARLFGELRAAPLEVGARHVVRRHPDDILEVATEEEGVVLNINDRESYEKILRMKPPASE
jgi:molybdenum cofactor cytidylyltransferase